jgi:hypothetical protein
MEQLAVPMPHSKQYLSFSTSKSLLMSSLEIAVFVVSKFFESSLALKVAKHIKVYKRKGFFHA